MQQQRSSADLGLLSEAASAREIADTGFVAAKITELVVLRTSVVERIRAVQLLTGADTCVASDGTVGTDVVHVDTVELKGLMRAVEGFKVQEGLVFSAARNLGSWTERVQFLDESLGRVYVPWAAVETKVGTLTVMAEDISAVRATPSREDVVMAFSADTPAISGMKTTAIKQADSLCDRYLSVWED